MPKIENGGLLNPEELETALCPVCSTAIKFTRNKMNEYTSSHCDRDIVLNVCKYQAIVTKNKNIVKVIEREHKSHPDPEIKQRRYV